MVVFRNIFVVSKSGKILVKYNFLFHIFDSVISKIIGAKPFSRLTIM